MADLTVVGAGSGGDFVKGLGFKEQPSLPSAEERGMPI
jgi:hypothetical protein